MEAHEIELVKRLQAGDQQAFDELYQQYYQRAVALAYRFTKDYADAEDIVQESFIQVHKSINTLQEPAYFYSWLNRIIHNKCVNLFYRNRNENAVDPAKMEAVKTYEEKRRYMLPHRESDYISEQEVLQRILSQMDDKYREVVELAYLQQMKLEEIAKLLDLPLGTIKTRCRRAKSELKRLIAEFEQTENDITCSDNLYTRKIQRLYEAAHIEFFYRTGGEYCGCDITQCTCGIRYGNGLRGFQSFITKQ